MTLIEFVKPDKKRIVSFIALAAFVYIAWTQRTPIPGMGLFNYMLVVLLLPVLLLYYFILHENRIVETLTTSLVISFYLYILSCFLGYLYENSKRKKSIVILIGIILLLFVLLGLWMLGVL